MNKKLKFKGSMKQFMRWPLYLTILLIWLDILIFMVSVKAGILATLGIVVYIVAALLLTRFHRPLILNDLIEFANQYESLCHYGHQWKNDLVQQGVCRAYRERTAV